MAAAGGEQRRLLLSPPGSHPICRFLCRLRSVLPRMSDPSPQNASRPAGLSRVATCRDALPALLVVVAVVSSPPTHSVVAALPAAGLCAHGPTHMVRMTFSHAELKRLKSEAIRAAASTAGGESLPGASRLLSAAAQPGITGSVRRKGLERCRLTTVRAGVDARAAAERLSTNDALGGLLWKAVEVCCFVHPSPPRLKSLLHCPSASDPPVRLPGCAQQSLTYQCLLSAAGRSAHRR